ncbi:prophage DLP12 integrase [Escherichia coli M605]|uniref:Prophage DLP12 integrase n=1 Tax=Escherichia coli M605 TaxID=656417 RepID=F4SV02_ECOLX|nr:prophage DLP12 integrase [Escherichia coli M605]
MPRCLITVENNHEASRNIWAISVLFAGKPV